MKKEKISSILGILFIILIFVFFSYLTQKYMDSYNNYISSGWIGMLIFVSMVASSIVFAPISSVPIFPLASGIWGWFLAGMLGVLGWTIGAVTAFLLARRYGADIVGKVFPIGKINSFKDKIPNTNKFWTLVFLRMVIPVDGVSYIYGLFSDMSLRSFTLATIIGLIPFSLVLAYLGTIPFMYQAIVLVVGIIIFLIFLIFNHYKRKKAG